MTHIYINVMPSLGIKLNSNLWRHKEMDFLYSFHIQKELQCVSSKGKIPIEATLILLPGFLDGGKHLSFSSLTVLSYSEVILIN